LYLATCNKSCVQTESESREAKTLAEVYSTAFMIRSHVESHVVLSLGHSDALFRVSSAGQRKKAIPVIWYQSTRAASGTVRPTAATVL